MACPLPAMASVSSKWDSPVDSLYDLQIASACAASRIGCSNCTSPSSNRPTTTALHTDMLQQLFRPNAHTMTTRQKKSLPQQCAPRRPPTNHDSTTHHQHIPPAPVGEAASAGLGGKPYGRVRQQCDFVDPGPHFIAAGVGGSCRRFPRGRMGLSPTALGPRAQAPKSHPNQVRQKITSLVQDRHAPAGCTSLLFRN